MIRYTLVSDGPSDQALMPILEWALRQAGVMTDLQGQWAELRNLRYPPLGLLEKIRTALDLYPCDLLFVHRDGEGQEPDMRKEEIINALAQLEEGMNVPYVCVIPVRMQEAWLLIDQNAIRMAAGNQYGRVPLTLPRARDLEGIADPKALLFELLRTASELTGRRLQRLSLSGVRLRIAQLIDDFAALRALRAFRLFEADLGEVVTQSHWA